MKVPFMSGCGSHRKKNVPAGRPWTEHGAAGPNGQPRGLGVRAARHQLNRGQSAGGACVKSTAVIVLPMTGSGDVGEVTYMVQSTTVVLFSAQRSWVGHSDGGACVKSKWSGLLSRTGSGSPCLRLKPTNVITAGSLRSPNPG